MIYTKSGVFVREEPHIGLLTYSPYSGLIYACDSSDRDVVLSWLNGEKDIQLNEKYVEALGPGWAINVGGAEYPVPHMLPEPERWGQKIPRPDKPILINWLITGSCPLACQYCYAEDLMRGRYPEPNSRDIEKIANTILDYDPLVVVLTGGDPLASPYLEKAIELLHSKTGIIIDTSAYNFSESHLKLFKKFNVLVRISLDSERPQVNNKLRPVEMKSKSVEKKDTVSAALNAIDKCIEASIKVAVQSVATKMNRSDFEAMGDKLYRLRVGGWRILMVAPSRLKYEEYLSLRGTDKGQKRFYNHILGEINSKYRKNWQNNMSVQVVHNRVPNAIILVSPDGTFLTESIVDREKGGGKIIIDTEHPKKPGIQPIFDKVDMNAHVRRYLNIHY